MSRLFRVNFSWIHVLLASLEYCLVKSLAVGGPIGVRLHFLQREFRIRYRGEREKDVA